MDAALEDTLVAIARFRRDLRGFSKLFEPVPKPPTVDADLVCLYLGIASLSSTGLLACGDGDIYSARSLTRVVAEHWMRFLSIVEGSAPADFFTDLQPAEAVEIDRRMRNCFPNRVIPADLPPEIEAAIQAALIKPEPSAAERDRAKEVVRKYQFDNLCKGILTALKAHDGKDDASSYVSMAFAYARFSACVHGGPLARDYIVRAPSASVVASTASDLLAPWTSSLILLLARRQGPEHADTRAALAIQNAMVEWVMDPSGPINRRST